jgi:hypothetical protein
MTSRNGYLDGYEFPTQEIFDLDGKRYLLIEFPLGDMIYDPDVKQPERIFPAATKAIPGSPEKIAVLMERVENGHADDGTLFHPDDLSFASGRIRIGHEMLDWGRDEWADDAPEEPTFVSLQDVGVE